MFATKELVEYRIAESERLKSEMKAKLLKVQKLVIKKVLSGKSVVFEISSYANAAMLHSINGINCGDKYYQASLSHYDHMDFDYDNQICEFYEKQIEVVDYWIKILS